MTLQTDRLVLRRWRPEDRHAFAALNADPEVMEHLPGTLSASESDAFADRIEGNLERDGFGLWAVEVRGGAPFVGFVGLAAPRFEAHFTPAVEIGWRLARHAWGRGYATEAGAAVLRFGFEEIGLQEIVSFTTPQNVRSRRVMERLGMRHDPVDDFDHPRFPDDARLRRHVLYRLVAKDWRSAVPAAGFMEEVRGLETAYLRSADPVVQSGFSGGARRWEAERAPLVGAIDRDGSFLDVGCANGLLAADVVRWAAAAGHTIEPFGVDLGPGLVELARRRLPDRAANFVVADAWTWQPDRRWTYVYSLLDLASPELIDAWMRRLASWVAPGGRLIVGSYRSRSRGRPPDDVAGAIRSAGLSLGGGGTAGDPPVSAFAWTEPLG